MENKMGHFVSWKFGIPVDIQNWHNPMDQKIRSRLIWENNDGFRVITECGISTYYAKSTFSYERIQYQQDSDGPVYPVCQARFNTTYVDEKHNQFGGITNSRIKPVSVATLNIDGKTIELSAETTAELKNKLGI